jgi:hypothetical protein
LRLGFAEIDDGREVWEYAVLVTSLDSEILSLGQLYRDRADCENSFDELKNQWGWGGFTTRDLKRCRLMAGCVALMFNCWNLFVRLADPDHHRIIARPSPAGPCCCKRSAARPAMPAVPPSPSPQATASTRAPAPASPASPAFSRSCAKLRSS